jgi:uncharacterized membrane protein
VKQALWHRHPHVRSGADLTFGERAADILKRAFGTWSLLGLIIAGIAFWMLAIRDPGELHLNLGLSFLASVQGVILQIAANRGDRISSELAVSTHAMLEQNNDLTRKVHDLATQISTQTAVLDEVHRHVTALAPRAGDFAPGRKKAP